MAQVIECVPNFSEGKNRQVIDAIAQAIRSTAGVTLLDMDPGASTNRTVYTLVGDARAVVEGAMAGARVAFKLIDMSQHKGEHKRMGALDVCPFIPVSGATMEDCVQCAHEFAKRLTQELDVPVYLYGYASKRDYRCVEVPGSKTDICFRKDVPQIRSGEYEGLAAKLQDPEWKPDYGSAKFVPKWGATIVGARKFLIAYNVNLVATKEQAHRIALIIRATKPSGEPGRLGATQAMGWYLKEQNIAQVTVNILDHEVTSIHTVYEEVLKEAARLKIPVTGSEIVGLVPLQAMLDVAQHYMERESLFVLEEDQKLHLAISRLGLNSLGPFVPQKRIIEYMVTKEDTQKLVKQSVCNFVHMVGDRTTAPGGGSVGANVGALGAALTAMVAKLAYGKKAFEHNDATMRQLIPPLHEAIDQLLLLVDEDTDAFTEYGEAVKLPANNETEKRVRAEAIEKGLRSAISVPLRLAQLVSQLWLPIETLVGVFHLPTASDLQVGVHCLKAAVYAAYYNVKINLRMEEARHLRTEIEPQIADYLRQAEQYSVKILSLIEERQNKNN